MSSAEQPQGWWPAIVELRKENKRLRKNVGKYKKRVEELKEEKSYLASSYPENPSGPQAVVHEYYYPYFIPVIGYFFTPPVLSTSPERSSDRETLLLSSGAHHHDQPRDQQKQRATV